MWKIHVTRKIIQINEIGVQVKIVLQVQLPLTSHIVQPIRMKNDSRRKFGNLFERENTPKRIWVRMTHSSTQCDWFQVLEFTGEPVTVQYKTSDCVSSIKSDQEFLVQSVYVWSPVYLLAWLFIYLIMHSLIYLFIYLLAYLSRLVE